MSQSHTPADQPDIAPPAFPCKTFPAVTRHARLLGIYPQRQPCKFMQRVRVPGGVLSAGQWLALAQAVRRFTPGTPLHLTTRQDVELHDLSEADVPQVQQLLAEAALTTLGSGGDTLRNIVVCPCSAGGSAKALNLLPLGRAIGRVLDGYASLFALPRKFKISLSGCSRAPAGIPLGTCARPFVHDLSFVALQRDGRWGLRVIGAGSLGPRPATGIELFDWIEPGDALPLALAAVRLFDRTGDRQIRAKARLRHVRQRLGDEAFLAELRREFDAVRAERPWPAVSLPDVDVGCAGSPRRGDPAHLTSQAAPGGSGVQNPPAGRNLHTLPLTFPNGDVSPEAAEALADLAVVEGMSVRIAWDHRVIVFAPDAATAQRELAKHPALASAARPQANVVACPGTRWCSRALADTNTLADRIRASLSATGGKELSIAVSGCPNGCAGSAVADIGVLGGRSSGDGGPVETYTILSGGGKGASGVLAQQVAKGLTPDQAIERVAMECGGTVPKGHDSALASSE